MTALLEVFLAVSSRHQQPLETPPRRKPKNDCILFYFDCYKIAKIRTAYLQAWLEYVMDYWRLHDTSTATTMNTWPMCCLIRKFNSLMTATRHVRMKLIPNSVFFHHNASSSSDYLWHTRARNALISMFCSKAILPYSFSLFEM